MVFLTRINFGLAGLLAILVALLPLPHFGVKAALAQQLGVGAAFGDPALVENDDLVGVDDGGEAVGDDDGGAIMA
mgnify:CR=1 FL=1